MQDMAVGEHLWLCFDSSGCWHSTAKQPRGLYPSGLTESRQLMGKRKDLDWETMISLDLHGQGKYRVRQGKHDTNRKDNRHRLPVRLQAFPLFQGGKGAAYQMPHQQAE